jgi:hypothetical protein
MRHAGLLAVAAAVVVTFFVAVGLSQDRTTGEKKPSGTPAPGAKNVLELTLSSDKKEYAKGERPVFTASLKNVSDGEVVVVGCLDGSCWGRRYPRWAATATVDGEAVAEEPLGMCGTVNPLDKGDVRTLKPGESMDPFGKPYFSHSKLGTSLKFDKVGSYKVVLTYDTEAAEEKRFHGAGEPAAEALALLARVARTKVASNELVFTVK